MQNSIKLYATNSEVCQIVKHIIETKKVHVLISTGVHPEWVIRDASKILWQAISDPNKRWTLYFLTQPSQDSLNRGSNLGPIDAATGPLCLWAGYTALNCISVSEMGYLTQCDEIDRFWKPVLAWIRRRTMTGGYIYGENVTQYPCEHVRYTSGALEAWKGGLKMTSFHVYDIDGPLKLEGRGFEMNPRRYIEFK